MWRVLIPLALGWFLLGAFLLGYRGEHVIAGSLPKYSIRLFDRRAMLSTHGKARRR